MSNRTLERIADKLNLGKNLTETELQLQLDIAKKLYHSEIEFERVISELQNQKTILKELEKVFPAEYVSHLKAEIATESDQIVRE